MKTIHQSKFLVEENQCGELFIRLSDEDNRFFYIRLNRHGHNGMVITTQHGHFTPWAVHGLPAIVITKNQ